MMSDALAPLVNVGGGFFRARPGKRRGEPNLRFPEFPQSQPATVGAKAACSGIASPRGRYYSPAVALLRLLLSGRSLSLLLGAGFFSLAGCFFSWVCSALGSADLVSPLWRLLRRRLLRWVSSCSSEAGASGSSTTFSSRYLKRMGSHTGVRGQPALHSWRSADACACAGLLLLPAAPAYWAVFLRTWISPPFAFSNNYTTQGGLCH